MEMKIAVIGLGVMGGAMTLNIIKQGFDVTACDADHNILEGFIGKVSMVSKSPARVAENRNVIITILPNSDIVEDVLFGEDGALSASEANSLIVDMSTGSYTKTIEIADRLTALGHRFVDAPVGRTPREAVSGNLLVMAGGSDEDVAAMDGIFNAVGDTVIHVGQTGCGLKAKLVNNYMAMVNNAVTGETLSFAQSVGLNVDAMAKLMSTTAAGLGQLNTNYPKKILAGDLTPDFPIFMAIKDLDMAVELAKTFDVNASFGELARQAFVDACQDGMGHLDQTAIMQYFCMKK